ncbi:hypothetical protein C0989_005245 [Termitomyces sp. Mn162]|nr:hypothetical protein C0989_005245 [Termitomyces sp. Mn162]
MSEIEFPIPQSQLPPLKNFREVDWEAFRNALKEQTANCLPVQPILSEEDFHSTVTDHTKIMQEVIAIEDMVLMRKPCPFTKRWWNKDLRRLKAQRH